MIFLISKYTQLKITLEFVMIVHLCKTNYKLIMLQTLKIMKNLKM